LFAAFLRVSTLFGSVVLLAMDILSMYGITTRTKTMTLELFSRIVGHAFIRRDMTRK